MSLAVSAWGIPFALENRTVAGSSVPGRKQPCCRSCGRSRRTRRQAFSTASTVLVWKARSTVVASLALRFFSCTSMSSRASSSNRRSSACSLPPSYRSYSWCPTGVVPLVVGEP